MRKFVVGDIHGGLKGLEQCLNGVNFDFDNDTLIQIGDICDGWSESVEVALLLSSIKNLVSIRGNHDVWALENLKSGRADTNWIYHGGRATLENYKRSNRGDSRAFIEFLENQLPYYIDGEKRLFIHAGYDIVNSNKPGYSIDNEISGGNLWWSRDYWKLIKGGYMETNYKNVYIGHTPTISDGSMDPIIIGNVINVDTGAAFYGQLTIMNIETGEYFKSDNLFKLYPNEFGRNSFRYSDISSRDKHLLRKSGVKF